MHAFHAVITSYFPFTKYRSCSQHYKKIIIPNPFYICRTQSHTAL